MEIMPRRLQVVGAEVVVEASNNGRDAVVTLLPGIQVLPLNDSLQLLRYQVIAARDVKSVCRESVKTRRPVSGPRVNAFLKKLTNKIKWTHLKPCIHAPRRSLVRSRQNERRKRTVRIHQESQALRDICSLVVAA